MISYYVIFHALDGTLNGFSTFMPTDSNIPDGYTFEERLETEYPCSLDNWNNVSRKFEKRTINTLTRYQFLERFTGSERIEIRSSNDYIVKDFMEMLSISQEVQLDNPLVQQGLYYLVSIGKLAENRPAEILRT